MKSKTSSLSLIRKGFSISIKNIWRNKVLSIATIFVMGIIIFIFNIIMAINFIANDSLINLSQKVDLVVYLKETTSFQESQNLTDDLNRIGGVNEVIYTSKEEALQQLKLTHPDLTLAFEKYGLGNPLPASLNIKTIHPKYHKSVAEFLEQEKYQRYLSKIITNEGAESNNILTSVSKNLLELTNFAEQIMFWLIITFIVGGALIILNALQITIFSRKKEISVMKLVGAPHWFIRLPFILEAIMYGILAITLSFLMLLLLSRTIEIENTSIWHYYQDIEFQVVFLVELIITVLLSVSSSLIAVHEHLRKRL